MKILTINNKTEEKFLRKKTADFDFSKFTKKELEDLLKNMKKIMRESIGIGLSANQIGLNLRLFVAQISTIPIERDEDNKIILPPDSTMKFYAIFNPEITAFSKETIIIEEGCLSVPGIYGEVKRPEKIVLEGYNRYGKKIKIKADGLLARVFQHEVDHLNGILFIDKVKNTRKIN